MISAHFVSTVREKKELLNSKLRQQFAYEFAQKDLLKRLLKEQKEGTKKFTRGIDALFDTQV